MTTAESLYGPQAGVLIQGGSVSVEATDGSSVTIIFNPTNNTAFPFVVEADINGFSTTHPFPSATLETGPSNPLFSAVGSNPRAGDVRFFVDDNASNRIDALQDFDIRASGSSPEFNFARLLQYAVVTDVGTAASVISVYGFPTAAANMPTTGSATWQGVGLGVFSNISGSSGYDFLGDAAVSVNFGTGDVSGTISNFTYTDGTTLITPADRVTSIALDANVSGDGFSGTALADFTVRADLSMALEGQFYGPSTAAPVEAGGAFGGRDATHLMYGGFVVGTP